MKSLWMLKWNWLNSRLSILIFYGVMSLVCLIPSILVATTGMTGSVNGFDISSYVMVMILGIVLFSQGIRFGLSNSVSRRSVYLGILGHGLLLSLIITVINPILSALFSLVGNGVESLFSQLYPSYSVVHSTFQGFLSARLIDFSFGLLFAFLGFFIGALYYRMSKVLRLVVSIGVPGIIFFIVPVIFILLPDSVSQNFLLFLARVIEGILTSPLTLSLIVLGLAAVFAAVLWPLTRRAPAKASSW